MSYDVSIADEWFNYTSNISALFYDHFPNGRGLCGIDGMTGKQAVEEIGKAFANMNDTRHELYQDGIPGEQRMEAKYNAPNGWGSVVGALLFLGRIGAACARHPRHKVSVDA